MTDELKAEAYEVLVKSTLFDHFYATVTEARKQSPTYQPSFDEFFEETCTGAFKGLPPAESENLPMLIEKTMEYANGMSYNEAAKCIKNTMAIGAHV